MAGADLPPPLPVSARLKAFNCPNCGAPVEVRAAGTSLSVVCGSCKSIIDVNDPNHQILSKAMAAKEFEPLLPLGRRGKIRGDLFEVIGYLRRCDETGDYEWDEYLLFNPFKGFAWLVEVNGHWTVLQLTKKIPVKAKSKPTAPVVADGEEFSLFLTGQSEVLYVLGEFYWKVKVGEKSHVAEYICPPRTISREQPVSGGAHEVSWSIGSYVHLSEMREAFKGIKFRSPEGIAPSQLAPSTRSWKKMRYEAFFALGFLTLIQFVSCARSSDVGVLNQSYHFDRAKPGMIVTDKFQLTGESANLNIKTSAQVANAWMSFTYSLINVKTGEATAFEDGIEYYYGSDSDGSWSEGSQDASTLLSKIPGGEYYLTIETMADTTIPSADFQVEMTRDVPTFSTYLLALFALMVTPALAYLKNNSFESRRWANSDYSPYSSGD